ncbi:MAG TPA: PAS domain-containing protein [Candidatus Acidoferrum sp.]
MAQPSSSNLALSQRFPSWSVALIGIIVIKAVLSQALKPGSFLVSYSGISYFFLLVLAAGFALRNGIQNTQGSRPFWVFLAMGYGLWSLHQSIFLYYGLVLHADVPNNSDLVLFLHVVPFMAALATLPHRNPSEHKPYRAVLNCLLLFFFWSFLYGYTAFPYQYLTIPNNYSLRFDILYFLENLTLVLAAGLLTLRARIPWKSIYFHLLGASALYTLSSAVANIAIDSGGYVNGKLYGLGLTASVCWFVWIPLRARQVPGVEPAAKGTQPTTNPQASAWAMLMVVAISIPLMLELLRRNESTSTQTFRLLIAIAAIVCLACAAYIKERLDGLELVSLVGLANHRLRLVMESGHSVAWDWDIKSGRDSWFGDLQSMFGVPSDTYVGRVEDFHRRVHPLDREGVAKAVKNAMNGHLPYAAEFRILWADGTVRWVAAKGTFYYAPNGDPERMLGVAVDITERKLAEEAVSGVSRRVIEAEERERNRIARDLHEDIGQRLALLAIEIEQLKTDPPDQSNEMLNRMDAVWKQTLEVLTDVKASAHELHSPRLEYLGIAAVMRSFCEEFGTRRKVEIDFRSHGLPSLVPPDISLCLFRVLQEALYNAVEHSGVWRFEVQLWGESEHVNLRVSDGGVGFELETATEGRKLGLIRMEERVKLLKGSLSIKSQPKRGTSIHAQIALTSGSDAVCAVG